MKLSTEIKLIGDPHFGIDFDKRGTPLHRRGERAAMQMAQFKAELREGTRLNIMVGDLFDVPLVPLKLVHEIVDAYEAAALEQPDKTWVLMAGNHDLFRQVRDPKTGLLMKGSFHAVARMLTHVPNVAVLFEPAVVQDVACFPWQWEVSAVEQVEKLVGNLPDIAVGHWDLVEFDGRSPHFVPLAELRAKGVGRVYSGHIHTAGDYGGVVCTGSLQPFTHGEDPSGTFYRTLTLDELERIEPDTLRDVNVRVLLRTGESLPELDCLSLVGKREDSADPLPLEGIDRGSFDMSVALEQRFEELQVPPAVRVYVREKIGAID